MNFKTLLAAAALLAPLSLHAQQADPAAIMEGARLSASLTKLDKGLSGNIVSKRKKTPVVLFLMGKNIQFQFSENKGPWQIFHMRLQDHSYSLYEVVNGKTLNFPKKKLVEPIAGSDLTYEDLSLQFLYWPNPKLEGIEKVGGQECYKIRIDKPKGAGGRYAVCYVWVHTKFGAFMKIRGHDSKGALIKEFQVEDIMKVANDTWTLRKMQVSSFDPGNGRRSSITELNFDTPNKAAPRGLR